MNIDRKKAILLQLKSKGFRISRKLERNLTQPMEEFLKRRIREKEWIIKELEKEQKKKPKK